MNYKAKSNHIQNISIEFSDKFIKTSYSSKIILSIFILFRRIIIKPNLIHNYLVESTKNRIGYYNLNTASGNLLPYIFIFSHCIKISYKKDLLSNRFDYRFPIFKILFTFTYCIFVHQLQEPWFKIVLQFYITTNI